MAFLDNSGDIILDAVLTDAGRKRMAAGDGSFNIKYFALGDDEIDYSLYNNQDSRGSAYYDIDILNTPVLEAFTDNMSAVKSKLMIITRPDFLYLPVLKIDGTSGDHSTNSSGSFYVAVNEATWDLFADSDKSGVLDAKQNETDVRKSSNFILMHQGIDNEAKESIDADLVETGFMIEIDDRFGEIRTKPLTNGTTQAASQSYVDDDNIASYILTGPPYVANLEDSDVIAGPTGNSVEFTIYARERLRETDYLMQRLGGITSISTSNDCYFVDVNVRVTGINTGYRVDVPVRFLKKIGS